MGFLRKFKEKFNSTKISLGDELKIQRQFLANFRRLSGIS
jgi:hypothetical protein